MTVLLSTLLEIILEQVNVQLILMWKGNIKTNEVQQVKWCKVDWFKVLEWGTMKRILSVVLKIHSLYCVLKFGF